MSDPREPRRDTASVPAPTPSAAAPSRASLEELLRDLERFAALAARAEEAARSEGDFYRVERESGKADAWRMSAIWLRQLLRCSEHTATD